MGRTGVWKVPGYVAEELIGSGAAGQVWRGRAVRTGEPVALKRLPGSGADRTSAARAEAALLSALDHPNLVRLRELVPTPNSMVLVLDLAEGGSLAGLLDRRGHLTAGETVSALAPIGTALAFAHDQGVVHGDVSPANVLFAARGHPLLADLGVARLLGDQSAAQSTLAYLDPGVATGSPPGAASDVFMLAATALHCLDGRPPWCGNSAEEIVAMAASGEIPGLDERLRAAPEPMAAVLRRGLSAAPHARGTAAEFALDLRHAAAPVAVELDAGRADARPLPPLGPGSRPGWSASAGPQESHRARHAVVSAALGRSAAGGSTPSARMPWRPHDGGGSRAERPDSARLESITARDPVPESAAEAAAGAAEAAGLPLTHAVRARLRPAPAPAPWWQRFAPSRTTAWCAALLLLAMVAAVGVGWWRTVQQADASAGAAVSRPAVGAAGAASLAARSASASASASRSASASAAPTARPTRPGPAPSGTRVGPRSRPSASESSARPGQSPAPTPTGTAQPSPPSVSTGWAATLAVLDAGRSRAFADRDAGALRQVWLPGPLLRQDTASLTRLVPAGCGLAGLRTSYTHVREVLRSASAATVTATADLAPARVMCRGAVLNTTAPRTGVVMTIGLVRTASGWRIGSMRLG